MTLGGLEIRSHEQSNEFANFFVKKVNDIVKSTKVDENVYNGIKKIDAQCEMFMTRENIRKCFSEMKIKNTEGYDRIPQRVLVDGLDQLLDPLSNLFEMIYCQKVIPGQWLVSKIIPVHKKGNKSHIENYRPVANLCSVSKVFEKLILNRIYELEIINGINLTGKQQHGFKKNKSTLTAGLLLQSLIAAALDDNNA